MLSLAHSFLLSALGLSVQTTAGACGLDQRTAVVLPDIDVVGPRALEAVLVVVEEDFVGADVAAGFGDGDCGSWMKSVKSKRRVWEGWVCTAVVVAGVFRRAWSLAFEKRGEEVVLVDEGGRACCDEACDEDAGSEHCCELLPNEWTWDEASVFKNL